MNTKTIILSLAISFFSASAFSASDKDCGAAGDGCAPASWKAYSQAATKHFPNWPEIGYRTYATLCHDASDDIKALCLTNPKKAAQALDLPPKDE